MIAEILIDTNILVYAYDMSEKAKWLKASKLLEKVWKKQIIYAVSLQNLSEFYVIVTKKIEHPLNPIQAKQIVEDIIAFPNWTVLIPNKETFKSAITLSQKYNIPLWDAQIASVAIQNGIQQIYTENLKDFSCMNAKNPLT